MRLRRKRRKPPSVVARLRPTILRFYPNDPVDTRTFHDRLDEAEILGRIRRAQVRGEIP